MNIIDNLFTQIRKTKVSAEILTLLRQNTIVISFFLLFLILSFSTNVFLSTRNILNVLDQASQLGIIACGMTITIICGCFDLSVGSIYAISGLVAAIVANIYGTPLGFLAGILLGVFFGVINGLVVTKLRITAFIATLATALVIAGIGLLILPGGVVTVTATNFNVLGRHEILGAKVSVYLWAGVIILAYILLHRTTFGRYIFAIGGNEEAARMSGIKIDLIRIIAFSFNGLCAGIAGVLAASRISTGLMDVGATLVMDSIAAIVIGGTSIMGGEGAIWRSVLGILLMQLIVNGFDILAIDTYWQQIFQGAIIIIAVALDSFRSKKT